MKESRKGMLMAALICGTMAPALLGGSSVYAAEKDEVDEALRGFTLDQIIVTATRDEKRDVDVPASTEVLTRDDIKKTGATNAAGAISKLQGLQYKSFGVAGASMGTMINEASIRGVDSGTLVMVNGNTIAWRGKYNLEAIQADEIERIEIVKGGGSVLYGSEAAAGVINIITKKKADNYVKAGIGNYGRKSYGASIGNDKIQVSYENEKWDKKIDKITEHSGVSYTPKVGPTKDFGETKTAINHVRRENIGLNYNINDNLSLNYHYFESQANYIRNVTGLGPDVMDMKVGDLFNNRLYTTKQHVTQLNYKDKNWKANIFFNTGTVESKGWTYFKSSSNKAAIPHDIYNTREKNRTLGADVQRNWRIGEKINAILGMDFKHENYHALPAPSTGLTSQVDASRNIWGVFGQWDQKIDNKNEFILSARETWTTSATKGQNYSNFSAAGQYVHKLDDNQSLYASIAQSFIMPAFNQVYKSTDQARPNLNLKPQKGINYEIGWKKIAGAHNWRAAIYHINIKDNISATWDSTAKEYQYTNEDFRNTGIEFGDTVKGEGPLSYNWSVSFSNPKSKSNKKPFWDRKFGRYQITGGIGYNTEKFNINLSGSFLGDRVQTPSSDPSYKVRPYFLTTLTASYRPTKAHEFTLTVDNLLDRHDVVTHSSSSYYSTPCNFLFEYKYKF